jgi:hypothetical protein
MRGGCDLILPRETDKLAKAMRSAWRLQLMMKVVIETVNAMQ